MKNHFLVCCALGPDSLVPRTSVVIKRGGGWSPSVPPPSPHAPSCQLQLAPLGSECPVASEMVCQPWGLPWGRGVQTQAQVAMASPPSFLPARRSAIRRSVSSPHARQPAIRRCDCPIPSTLARQSAIRRCHPPPPTLPMPFVPCLSCLFVLRMLRWALRAQTPTRHPGHGHPSPPHTSRRTKLRPTRARHGDSAGQRLATKSTPLTLASPSCSQSPCHRLQP